MTQVNSARKQVASLAFSASEALLEVRQKLTMGEGQGQQKHAEYWKLSQLSGLTESFAHELSHGATTPRLSRTVLGEEHLNLLTELTDLSERLQDFAVRVILE